MCYETRMHYFIMSLNVYAEVVIVIALESYDKVFKVGGRTITDLRYVIDIISV